MWYSLQIPPSAQSTILYMHLKVILLKLPPHLPGANGLTVHMYSQAREKGGVVIDVTNAEQIWQIYGLLYFVWPQAHIQDKINKHTMK